MKTFRLILIATLCAMASTLVFGCPPYTPDQPPVTALDKADQIIATIHTASTQPAVHEAAAPIPYGELALVLSALATGLYAAVRTHLGKSGNPAN